jgi:hypothetical protein
VSALFTIANWHPDKNPWYDAQNRPDSGGRMFHKAYSWGRWVSYVKDAKLKYGVSAYQWRAPGEWFAEAYAVYYSDHDSPAGTPMGTRLRTRDVATAAWFDKNVDKGYSLQKKTNQTNGGTPSTGTAPGTGPSTAP